MKHEENLSLAVCRYLKFKYPHVIFTMEASGIRLGFRAAVKLKQQRSCNGLPDLIILHPNKQYHGLLIELKKSGTKLTKVDGSPLADEHIKEQRSVLDKLSILGYKATFAVGVDSALSIIDAYMNNK